MKTLLLILIAVWISAAAGRTLVDRLKISGDHAALERFVYAAALGLGIAAYGVYGLGLCGLLAFWPITGWWLTLAVFGWRGSLANSHDVARWRRSWRRATQARGPQGANQAIYAAVTDTERWITSGCALALLVFGLIALASCYRPPGPQEWDVLSYHLADPKLFLQAHRVQTLPTEHHSNFPFTLEMLYAVGLLYDGYALANAFHLVVTLLTVGALIGFCRRLECPVAGWLAGVAYLTTPIVLWESGTAYIDNGLALYVTLGTFAVLSSLHNTKDLSHSKIASSTVSYDRTHFPGGKQGQTDHSLKWLLLAGAMIGFGLGIKYLALIPFTLLALLLVVQRTPWKRIVSYAGVALAIGSPWYIKNAVVMHNPVYPFAYSVFPGSRYWSAERAAGYQSEQNKFGSKPASTDARSKILNLARVPWDLLIQHPDQAGRPALLYCNPGEFTFTALYGGLYAALLFPLAFAGRVPTTVRLMVWIALGQIVAWFALSQVGRYLILIMPLLAAAGAYMAATLAVTGSQRKALRDQENILLENIPEGIPAPATIAAGSSPAEQQRKSGRQGTNLDRARSLPGWLGIAAILGQAAYALLSVCTLPANPSTNEMLALMQFGQLPSSVSVPFLAANLDRSAQWDADLRRHFDAYSAMQWINRNTPADAGVALYEETRGFYLDRAYLWANQQHSSYIPYETMKDGRELSTWMLAHGYRYALINLNAAAQNHQADAHGARLADPDLPFGPNRYEIQALEKWYAQSRGGDRGHQLVGDAVRQSLWVPVFQDHGCVVLQLHEADQSSANDQSRGARRGDSQ